MGISEQAPDGSWRPACPEPLWVGWRLRIAQCECGEKFKDRTGEVYRRHWRAVHAPARAVPDQEDTKP